MPYGPDEQALRRRVQYTVWQPGFHMPGSLGPGELITDVKMQFPDIHWPRGIWVSIQTNLSATNLDLLQCYWAWAVQQGRDPFELPPEWLDQRNKAVAASGIGTQRSTPQDARVHILDLQFSVPGGGQQFGLCPEVA